MIARFFAPLICYLFGHDKIYPHKIYPHPNYRSFGCVRCRNGPLDQWEKSLVAYYRKKEAEDSSK